MDEKLPPSSAIAEEAVLGSLLIDNDAIPRVAALLEPEDFHDGVRASHYRAMLALWRGGVAVDQLTLLDSMDGSYDPQLLARAVDATPTSLHAEHHARIVARLATRRRLVSAAESITKAAYDEREDLGELEDEAVRLVLEARGRERRDARPLSELARAYYDRIGQLCRRDSVVLGVPTGFADLDAILGGLHRSDLVVLAARPRIGKTSLSLGIAVNAARLGHHVAFFSLEMSAEQVVRRLVSLESAVPVTSLRTGSLAESDWPAFAKATDTLDRLPIWVDDAAGITPEYLRAAVMRLDAEHGLDLVVVDYLQLMRLAGRQKSRYETVTEIGQSLKALARNLDVPVLALSQLNRSCEARLDKHPQLHDLRESGDLEQTANVVILLYRDELYNENTERPNIADVTVAKNRDGPEGTCSLFFRKELAQFQNAEVRRQNVEDAYANHWASVL